MPNAALVEQLAALAARRLGGNLRLLALYGSAAESPQAAHDFDFFLVVDAVENCVGVASQECRDVYPNIQFFVLNTDEYAALPGFYRFQFAFARRLHGDLSLPVPSRADAVESVLQGYTDTLRTLRQQYKRREWAIADDWARQVWWDLKSFKYATLDFCWLLRGERTHDVGRAALVLQVQGLNAAARAVSEWPTLDAAAAQLKTEPLRWLTRWERLLTAAYAEIRPLLTSK